MIDDKIPPHNQDAEESVIGSLLIDGEAIYNINQFLKPDDFFTMISKWIYESITEIMNRGEAVNQITVAHQLNSQGKLGEIGGVGFLSGLIANCATSADIEHYARIVKNTAIARRAISAGQKIMAQGFTEINPNKIVSEAEKIILELQKEVAMPKLLSPTDIAQMSVQRYDDLNEGKRKGIYTGFTELDESLGGLFGGELCYIAGRPGTGKTETLLSIGKYVGLQFGNVLLASLEQPWGDITDRLLGREIEMSPRRIRAGCYSPEVLQSIMRFTGEIPKSNLYFYDSGGDIDRRGATTKSIYSIASHIKIAYGLRCIIIDYLGLLDDASGEKSYERISQISRKLKRLAMDLDLPVICAAQLNREVERRIDHKPQISDLRDCVTGDTEILDWHGIPRRVKGFHYTSIRAIDDKGLFKKARGRVYEAGIKDVFLMKSRLGFSIKSTGEHRFLTPLGFKKLADLNVGDSVAIPSKIPIKPFLLKQTPNDLCRLIGYLLGDGGLTRQRSANWTESDQEVINDGLNIIQHYFPSIKPKIKWYRGAYKITLSQEGVGYKKNSLINYLRKIGVWGQYSHERKLPDSFLGFNSDKLRELLIGLFTADGCIKRKLPFGMTISFDSNSYELIGQVRLLLMKFGILASLNNNEHCHNKLQRHIMYRLSIDSVNDIKKFISTIGFIGKKNNGYSSIKHHRGMVDRLPREFTDYLYSELKRRGLSYHDIGYRVQLGKGIERERLAKIAKSMGDKKLYNAAKMPITWVKIKSIEYIGKEMTYDVEVPTLHNFVANYFIVHNSGAIEQDADTILLIYRPDLYEEEIHKAKEDGVDIINKAHLIIGKQRQGGEVAGSHIALHWNPRKRCYEGNERTRTVPEQFR